MVAGDTCDRGMLMATLPNVRLDLLNKPENVLLVREALTGVAETIGLDGTDLSDIRTAVTEACNNVVLHAYDGEDGPLEVEVVLEGDALEVLVRDHGVGLASRPAGEEGEPGIGLPVIEALTDHVEFAEPEGGAGTEVRMSFTAPPSRTLESGPGDTVVRSLPDWRAFLEGDEIGTATVSIAPTSLARAVLPRLLSVLAARAHFSTDRISDSQMLADALVAHAGSSISGGYLSMAVSVEPREVELRVGPLLAGRAQRLVLDSDVEGLGSVLEKLADSHGVRSTGSHDTLTLQLLDRA
jgi:anti-sigma regulatory factor (Ser/Thr protein kinase)